MSRSRWTGSKESGMLKGKKLEAGDTIGLIGPSGTVREAGAVDQAIEYMKSLGFQVKVGESAHAKYGYLSGKDEVRARYQRHVCR